MANGWGGARPGAGAKKKPREGIGDAGQRQPSQTEAPSSDPPKAAATPKSGAASDSRRPMFSTDAVAMLIEAMNSRAIASRNRPRTQDWNPYIIRPDRFGPGAAHIQKNNPRLAMDSNAGLMQANGVAIQAWQAGGLIGNAVSEGLLFLGYPYLAELSQRPEFRLFAAIHSEEMTRKGTAFRGTDDDSTKERDKPKKRNQDDLSREREKSRTGEGPRSDARNKEIETKIKELRDFEADLKLSSWIRDAAAQDAYFGISHLLVDLKDTDPENIRDPELRQSIGNGRDKTSMNKLQKGCLRGFRTIEPIWVYPTTYNAQNPLVPSWYDPQVWYVMGTEIHKTRLLTFIGRPVPDILKPAYCFGGLALSQMAQPYVEIWLKTRESVGEIVHAYSVMVLATDLQTTVMPGGLPGGGGDVLGRVALFNMLRDNQGCFVINKATEDFKNVSASLAGLSELQAQAQEHMCSVARIPVVKFTGIQPKGLNATSEGELRAFNDTIHGEQEHFIRPNLTSIYDIMQISLWGARDPDITFDFEPLEEMNPKELGEMQKLKAETDQILIDAGVIWQEDARRRIVNDPESGYHNLDPEDVPDLLEEEQTGLIPEGAGRGIEAELQEAEGEKIGGDDYQPNLRRDQIVEAGGVGGRDAWRESDHPRGQPSNAGQFGPGGGGRSKRNARSSGWKPPKGVKAYGLQQSDALVRQWQEHTPTTMEGILRASISNQTALASACARIAESLGAHFQDPGPKSAARLAEKVARGKAPNRIKDGARAGFSITHPEDGDKAIAALAEKFDVSDEGWVRTPGGYFDRKVIIRFPDGQLGEVQFWPPGMIEAKDGGERPNGHDLYQEWQKLPRMSQRARELHQKMLSLYDGVRAKLPRKWESYLSNEPPPNRLQQLEE